MHKQISRRETSDTSSLPESLHPILKAIYASRGISNAEQLKQTADQMHKPNELMGLDVACQLLFTAIKDNKRIIVVGDFDADGATSTALMMDGLRLLGSTNHDFLVPNRFEFGYGLTPEISEMAVKSKAAEVIVTVDNGISCIAGVAKAKELGCMVIVTDHHLPGQALPDADAIVNPNQRGCTFPSKALAGVGVAFYLMAALRQIMRANNWFEQQGIGEPNIAQLLDLVALGTVADVVSFDKNNRILVAQGLKRIRAGATRPGIQALIEVSGKNQYKMVASDFGFGLGPRLNAAGRLDDMGLGIQCLLATDLNQARVMASELDDLNKARREIEQGMQYEAENVLKSLEFTEDNLPSAIALFQDDWHQGVIGIVAGRLKEKFHRPTIVFASANTDINSDNTEIKGSARSIPGLHIRDLLEHIDSQHPGLILKFGGHAMAAGLSIDKSNFAQFQTLLNEYAQKWLSVDMLQGKILSDGELSKDAFNLEFASVLREAGPWGQNFAEPVFDNHFRLIQQRIVGEKHLKMVVEIDGLAVDAIAFNIDIKQWPNHQCEWVHLAYKLDINEFRGKQTVQLLVDYLQPA
ncbi:single-stranded-DNA-specific exonuclease RecJ [Thalassomonas sp. M1454]|uniref:single-stranded-DNA-specific exonuclease RecJ n=1 Tax=Thalassomonas sp. M1454 TaxID=2594477 RepID=UPI00117D630A|nr:single-stranded-DNA-specific exonuclease RecJ [Thalassomonas sp. M1454]TRX54551.1 single-stranded-DNA-specific exonuclease RecJ [Thalassomonas sp. M1454]